MSVERTTVAEVRTNGPAGRSPTKRWTFLTNHGQVLLAIAQDPDLRVKEIAEAAGITERYAYRLLSDLEEAGYVRRIRQGRSNVYRVNPDLALGDPVVGEQLLGELLRLIDHPGSDGLAMVVPHRRSA